MHVWKQIRWIALIALTAAAAIAANVALLDVAERQDDPVGKLSRRVLIATIDQDAPPSQPTTKASTEPAVTASSEPSANTETNRGTGSETDDQQDVREPGETDDD
jgi:hypothetical protein